MGLVMASCFFKETQNPELKTSYEDIEAQVLKLKAKILKGNNKEEDVQEFDLDAERIVGKFKELVGKK